MTAGDGEPDAEDAVFEARLESTLEQAVDGVEGSPELRTAIEHAATGGAFAAVEASQPGPGLRDRVADGVTPLAEPGDEPERP